MTGRMRRIGAIAIVLLAVSGCGLASQGASAADTPALEMIALDLSGPRPTAQLTIGDAAPVTAIFDSAAAASVLRLDYATRLNLRRQGEAAAHGPGGAPVSGFRTTIEDAALGGVSFPNALAVALDLPLPLGDVDAIISPGVFSGRLVRFDFQAGAAQILAKTPDHMPTDAAEPYLGEDSHGRMNRIPGVRVALPGGESVVAIVDTGSPRALTLPLEMASRLPLAAPLTPTDPVRMLGAARNAFAAQLVGDVRIGPLVLHDQDVIFVENSERALVGMQILRNTIIVLDPGEHRAWILPVNTASADQTEGPHAD